MHVDGAFIASGYLRKKKLQNTPLCVCWIFSLDLYESVFPGNVVSQCWLEEEGNGG